MRVLVGVLVRVLVRVRVHVHVRVHRIHAVERVCVYVSLRMRVFLSEYMHVC